MSISETTVQLDPPQSDHQNNSGAVPPRAYLSPDTAAVNDVCRIFARILMRLTAADSAPTTDLTGGRK